MNRPLSRLATRAAHGASQLQTCGSHELRIEYLVENSAALQSYAKRADGEELLNNARRIKIRAIDRIGDFLKWCLDWRGHIDALAATYHDIGGDYIMIGLPSQSAIGMSMIATSGLWTLSHSSADLHETKDPPTDRPASVTTSS